MKKVFSVFLLALVAVSYASAETFNDVHIKVVANAENRAQISLSDPNGGAAVVANLTTTAQEFTIVANTQNPYHGEATISSLDADDVLIDSIKYVLDDDDKTTGSLTPRYSNGPYVISPSYSNPYLYEGATFTVYTTSLKETRTANIQVNIVGEDNAYERVKITRSSDGKAVAVESNNFTIPYNPNLTTPETFTITTPSSYDLPLYKVERDGSALQFETSYTIDNLEDGVTVVTITPNTDITVPVKINLLDETEIACINWVKVNGENQDASVWNADEGFSVPWGQKVEIQFNTVAYKVYVNGELQNTMSYSIDNAIKEEGYTCDISAGEWGTIEVTLEVNTPAAITCACGSNAPQTPTETTATLGVPENAPRVTISVVSGYVINSVKTVVGVTENDIAVNYGSCTIYPAEDGMKIIVDAEEIVRDKQFVFYVDDVTVAYNGAYVCRVNNRTYAAHSVDYGNGVQQLVSGYNVINFNSTTDNPHYFNAQHNSTYIGCGVYYNDEKQASTYLSPYTSYTIKDKDVLKVFLVAEPETHNVTFIVADGVEPTVLRDIFVPVEDLTEPLSVLTGTRIDIQAAGVSVKANDNVLSAENGVFSVTISADTEITISKDQGTAIANTEAAADNNVYTLQGMLLIKNATQAQINALPAGLYIINGKTSYLLQR